MGENEVLFCGAGQKNKNSLARLISIDILP
jgi:hypothetical protein